MTGMPGFISFVVGLRNVIVPWLAPAGEISHSSFTSERKPMLWRKPESPSVVDAVAAIDEKDKAEAIAAAPIVFAMKAVWDGMGSAFF